MGASLIGVIGDIPLDDGSRKQAAILERIKPVSQVSFEQPKPVVAVQLSGKEVYDKVCAACHVAGTLGAPKVGDKAAWEPRLAQGMDTLVNHALNGIRAMPAKGGDPSLTEGNMKDAIVYMLGESGIKVEAAPAEATTPAPTAAAPTPPPAPAESN
ncbi:MAG: cytochrome c5 family protein [Gammaproteobacteria bacterium]|nr:cytochrome c5 family protein [Gammaproteobacteria bacterium]